MLQRWLDRDDITAEDLDEMTAEEEVLDWMYGSPVPARRRPEWLPTEAWDATQERAPLGPAFARPPRWPLLLTAGLFVLSAGAVGCAALAAWAAVWWVL